MVNIYKDKQELAITFCDELFLLSKLSKKFNLALSGGSTPKIIFQELASNYKTKIDWEGIHLFWSDERCVPPDNAESNYGMTKKYLLDHLNIPVENIHRIKGENDPEVEAIRYSNEIINNIRLKSGLPIFDLIVLGLGEDGHTASIFPNQMRLLQSEKICEVAVHPSTKQKRITLTGKVINNAEVVIFLVTGESKSEILKKILVEKSKNLPAAQIHPATKNLKFIIDEAAARML